jgi:hypothetical protein
VVRRIFDRYASGTGLARIVAELTLDGAPAPRPRTDRPPGWSTSAILAMLERELYRGVVVWGALQKTDVGGRTKVRRERPEAERIRVEVPARHAGDGAAVRSNS